MPKQTFYNLEKEKKDRLLEACFEEFSQYTFTESSINRIIKSAEISRGSFYQYFENKEDCYMEVLGIIAQEKYALFKDVVQDESHGVFDDYINMLSTVRVWMEAQPRYYKIGILMQKDDSDFIKKLNDKNPNLQDYFNYLIRKDQERGIIRKDIDPVLLTEVLTGISQKILLELFVNKEYDLMIKKSREIIQLLQQGTNVQ
jgi:TetR/AcrR family transcriptional regulator